MKREIYSNFDVEAWVLGASTNLLPNNQKTISELDGIINSGVGQDLQNIARVATISIALVGSTGLIATENKPLDTINPIKIISPSEAKAETISYQDPETSFIISDNEDTKFWTEYRRFGGIETLGCVVSAPYEQEGFKYQVCQRGILQWRPEKGQAVLTNTMDMLHELGKDAELEAKYQIPPHLTKDDGSNGDFQKAKEIRFGWLTESHIKDAYFKNPNPQEIKNWDSVTYYGLPTSEPKDYGPFINQRFQRYVLQYWKEGPNAGKVMGVLVGDYAKEIGLVPLVAFGTGGPTNNIETQPIVCEPFFKERTPDRKTGYYINGERMTWVYDPDTTPYPNNIIRRRSFYFKGISSDLKIPGTDGRITQIDNKNQILEIYIGKGLTIKRKFNSLTRMAMGRHDISGAMPSNQVRITGGNFCDFELGDMVSVLSLDETELKNPNLGDLWGIYIVQ